MCGHLEILSVRSANLPAGEGVAFLSRNGSDCNIGIEDVGFSVTVILAVNLVGYVVLVDAELSIETNVLCRHGELAVSINSYDIRDIRPAGKGIAFLFRMSGSYGYVSAEGVGIDVAKLRCVTLLILIEVGHLGIDRIPLCVQVQVGHQKLVRTDCLFCALGVVWIGVPAAEGVAVRNGKHILENGIFLAGGSVFNGGRFNRAGDSAIVRVISYSNRNTGYIAVNMIAVSAFVLYGVPNNLNLGDIEIALGGLEKVLDFFRRMLGLTDIGAAVPVACGRETEVGRRKQIVAVNAIGIEFALDSGLLARFGQIACVTFHASCIHYAAVRSLIRQVICPALACAALRLTTVRQKYEILSRGPFRFRFDRGSNRGRSGPMSLQYQILVRHRSAGLILDTGFLIEPAIEGIVFLFNFRYNDRLLGINRTFGVTRAREFAAVFVIGQLMRLLGRLDVNLDGSRIALSLGKIKAELIFAVCLIAGAAEIRRLRVNMSDGVIGVDFTNRNERNGKRTVVPELSAVSGSFSTISFLNDDLIGYAVVRRIVSVIFIYYSFVSVVIRPVGNVNLNHLRIVGANQIVEYQLVEVGVEAFPTVVFLSMLIMVLEIT